MGYAILRTQKLKDFGSIHRSLKHAFRAQDTPNADIALMPKNTHLYANSVTEAFDAVKLRLPEKRRKDAVLAIEYLITASPEKMREMTSDQQDRYFQDSLAWLKTKHGDENVIYAGVHRDEQTPHMYAYVVPIDSQGKLNCRAFLGGAKALNQMQTEFAQRVGENHGLERGIEGSKARHQTVKQFYANIQSPFEHAVIRAKHVEPKVLERKVIGRDISETSEQVAQRLTKGIQDYYEPAVCSHRMKLQLEKQKKALEEQKKRQADSDTKLKEREIELKRQQVELNQIIERKTERLNAECNELNRVVYENVEVIIELKQERDELERRLERYEPPEAELELR